MIQRLRNQNKLYTFMTVAVLAAALFFVYRMISAGLTALPYPKEILEPSNIALTNEFLSGDSPYTRSALTRGVPGINYDYPPLNSLLAAGIAKITGCTAVTAHFAISLFSVLASGVIGFTLVRGHRDVSDTPGQSTESGEAGLTTVAPALAAIIFMFCHFRYGYISAAPDDLGLMLLLLTSAAAVSPKIKNKPLVCAFGITLCFYTKQYFVFVAAGLFIYMLMYSVKDAVKLFLWTLVINVAAGTVVTLFWPLYWTKAFFFTYLGTAVGGGGRLSTLTDQFVYILTIFGPLFLIMLISVIKHIKSREHFKVTENDAFSMSLVQTIVMIAPLFVIGRNDGAFLSYFLQLWIPFVTVVALISFEKMGRGFIHAAVYAAAAAFMIYFGFTRLPLHVLTQEEISDWQRAYEYTQKFSEQGSIYYARSLAYDPTAGDMTARNITASGADCICGHDGEVSTDTVTALKNAGLPDNLTQYAKQIVDQNLSYREDIRQKARDHAYSLITFDNSGAYTPFDEELCEEAGYRCIDRIDLQLGNMPYEVLFYVPL